MIIYIQNRKGKLNKMRQNVQENIRDKKKNEVNLFRALSSALNTDRSYSCYSKEIHGGYNSVNFNSKYFYSIRRELGDLLLLTFDNLKKEIRICILQAKYEKKEKKPLKKFKSDFFQWDLLLNKYDVKSVGKIIFPKNILNFQNQYKTISSFGIFYIDNNKPDMIYTIPDYMKPNSFPCKSAVRTFYFDNSKMLSSKNEIFYTSTLNKFASAILSNKIGAPLHLNNNHNIVSWVYSLLKITQKNSETEKISNYILDNFPFENFDLYNKSINENTPHMVITITNYKNHNFNS